MLPVSVQLDRLVMLIANVTMEEYDSFITKLQANSIFYPKTVIKQGISSGASQFRYNLNFGFGEGGIRLDYRHNSRSDSEKFHDIRIEFNPAKLEYGNYSIEVEKENCEYEIHKTITKEFKPSKRFFEILNTHFTRKNTMNSDMGESNGHIRLIRELDVAFDFNIQKEKIMVAPLTGKEPSLVKGTRYWGSKHTHGYLKVYDKKKERERFKDKKYEKYEHLTRIEYTMRFEGRIGITEMDRIKEFEISKQYQINVLDPEKIDKFDPTIKAYVLCYLNGLMQMNEFSRRYKEKTKKALEELTEINLDYILQKQFKNKVIQPIKKFIRL